MGRDGPGPERARMDGLGRVGPKSKPRMSYTTFILSTGRLVAVLSSDCGNASIADYRRKKHSGKSSKRDRSSSMSSTSSRSTDCESTVPTLIYV